PIKLNFNYNYPKSLGLDNFKYYINNKLCKYSNEQIDFKLSYIIYMTSYLTLDHIRYYICHKYFNYLIKPHQINFICKDHKNKNWPYSDIDVKINNLIKKNIRNDENNNYIELDYRIELYEDYYINLHYDTELKSKIRRHNRLKSKKNVQINEKYDINSF